MSKTSKAGDKKLDEKLFAAIVEASEMVENCSEVECAADIKEMKRQNREIVKLMEPLNKKQSDVIDGFAAGKISKARYDTAMKKLLKESENVLAAYRNSAPVVDLKACSLAHCNPDVRRLLKKIYEMVDDECGVGGKKSCDIRDRAKKLLDKKKTVTAEEYLDFMWEQFRAIS